RRQRPRAGRTERVPGGQRVTEPAPLPAPGRPRARLVPRPSVVRPRGPAHSGAEMVVSGPGPGAAPVGAGDQVIGVCREGDVGLAGTGPPGRAHLAVRRASLAGRPGIGVRAALWRLHRNRSIVPSRAAGRIVELYGH